MPEAASNTASKKCVPRTTPGCYGGLAGQCAIGSQSDKLKKPGWLQVIKHVDVASLEDEQTSVNTDTDGNTSHLSEPSQLTTTA